MSEIRWQDICVLTVAKAFSICCALSIQFRCTRTRSTSTAVFDSLFDARSSDLDIDSGSRKETRYA
jgi:hypothetical protein